MVEVGFLRWIILSPLAGAIVLSLIGRKIPRAATGIIACAAVGLSFLLGLSGFLILLKAAAVHGAHGAHAPAIALVDHFYTWIAFGGLNLDIAFTLDRLSAVMILVVSGVSFLIHIYSIGYMAHDKCHVRYFTYLNLFVFFMLVLVSGSSLPVMFIGWEGVGLCSYLLIGFWFTDNEKASAGKKAFIVNRIGDFGFVIGIIILFWNLGTFNFSEIAQRAPEVFAMGGAVVTAITLLLFVGATGKSAQIPLYVWLPDAMAGPTPVSALIHAATMVTAGVYMIVRLNVLFWLAPVSMLTVAAVGAVTAIFAASIGLVQNDIKKVLAYSTVSQLGYMFLAVGVGAFSAGIFHLMTHAFFKALLFLGAGSVIHAMSDKQDIREMGGLRKKMPITFWTFFIATLAISGIPPFSGFFSKDEILWSAFSGARGNIGLWVIGFIAAGMTAFYMFRLVFLTFTGECRADEETKKHIHESPSVMTMPLAILAVLAAVGGLVGIPEALGGGNQFHHWLAPVLGTDNGTFEMSAAEHFPHSVEYVLIVASVLVAVVGIFVAWTFYVRNPALPEKIGGKLKVCHRILLNKYYIDEIYNIFVVQVVRLISVFLLWKFIDKNVIDGFVNLTGSTVRYCGKMVARVQNGYAQAYAIAFLLGAALIVGSMIWSF